MIPTEQPSLVDDSDKADAAKQVTLRLHELLARVLAEQYGESLCVDAADWDIEGNVRYSFEEMGFQCFAVATVLNDRAGAVAVTVRLGRLYKGYPQALRWLASNRAGNTVGLYFDEQTRNRRELWVSSHRVTFADDEQGLRELLLDVKSELLRLQIGLGCHFPQLLNGVYLAALEEHIRTEKNQAVAAILACPKGFVDAVEQDSSILERTGLGLAVDAAYWVCDWEKRLKWLELALDGDKGKTCTPEEREAALGAKLVTLAWLSRHEECLRLADQFEQEFRPPQAGALATLRCHALYGLGRYDDLLESVRSATFDETPRVWFWRSLALARLGQVMEAADAFLNYERKLGTDIIGRRELKKALPPEQPPKKDESPEPGLEIKL
jgi:tetratricopeptide (TPR) repeat protein